PTDSVGKLVLNEEAVHQLGFTPQTAVGKAVFFDFQGNKNRFDIIGVVKDYHNESLHEKIRPFGFIRNRFYYNYALVNLSTTDLSSTIKKLQGLWKDINGNEP